MSRKTERDQFDKDFTVSGAVGSSIMALSKLPCAANALALGLCGNLRMDIDPDNLAHIKRELRNFNLSTRKWKD